MTALRTRAAVYVLAAGLALSPVLAGCGGTAEQAAEQALGGDVELDDGNVTVTDEEGNEVAIGEDVSLPDNWPADVPAYDGGTLAMASVQADGSAFATWMTDASPEDAAAAYGAALEDAGYTAETNSNLNGMFVSEYTGNGYTVGFNTIATDGQTTLMVTVSKG